MDKNMPMPNEFMADDGALWVFTYRPNMVNVYRRYSEGVIDPNSPSKIFSMEDAARAYSQSISHNGHKSSGLYQDVINEMNQMHKPEATSPSEEVTAQDLLNRKVESIPYLVDSLFQAVGLAAVVGSSDVGKSTFLRQLGFAVGTGNNDFLGYKIDSKHQSAIIVSTENDETATAFLLNSLNQKLKKPPADCAGLRFIFDTTHLLEKLDKSLTDRPADLVILDAFGDLYAGDANKSNQIRCFLHAYSQLAQKHQCLILWLHHTGKRTDDQLPSKHNVIGGQGFEGKMRLVIELRRDYADPTLRHLCIVKGNYLPDEVKNESYVLMFEDFLFTPTGDRVSFEYLVRPKEGVESDKQKYEKAKKLHDSGVTLSVIAIELGYSDASGVRKLLKRYDPVLS